MMDNSEYYLINAQENVLAVRLTRSWDLSITQQFCLDNNHCISSTMPDKKWALIGDISHWCLQTETACENIFQHHKGCIRQGLTHQVFILPKSSLKRWRIKAFVSSDFSIKTHLAENERDAINWLGSKGFKFTGFSSQIRVI